MVIFRNVAMDAGRRNEPLGLENHIIYCRSMEELPACKEETEYAAIELQNGRGLEQ